MHCIYYQILNHKLQTYVSYALSAFTCATSIVNCNKHYEYTIKLDQKINLQLADFKTIKNLFFTYYVIIFCLNIFPLNNTPY
jgi:hypothetical protein